MKNLALVAFLVVSTPQVSRADGDAGLPAVVTVVADAGVSVALLPDGGVITAATAPQVVSEKSNPADLALRALKAAQAKDWKLFFALLVSILAWGFRRFGKNWIPFLGTDRGGVVTVLVLTFVAAVTNTLIALGSQGLNAGLLMDALQISLLSIGGYVGLKKLLFPADAEAPAPPPPAEPAKP